MNDNRRIVCALTAVFLVVLVAPVFAEEMPVMPYDSLMDDRVSADGYIEREEGEFEYPAEFINRATGMTVSWGFDDSLMYLGVETKGAGWFGIGFGSPTMDESNFLVGYYTDETADVLNLVGKGHGHEVAGSVDTLASDWDIDFDDDTGIRCWEVIYPLKWRGEGASEWTAGNEVLDGTAVSGLEPGDIYDLVIAQHTKTADLSARHTHRTTIKFRMAENPNLQEEEGK